MRIGAICVLAAFAVGAVAAATASAEPPEVGRCSKVAVKKTGSYSSAACTAEKFNGEYEWTPGAAKAHFTDKGGAVKLETVKKQLVTCKSESSSGEYTSPKTVGHVVIVLTGCESGGMKCTSAGQAEGTIATTSLSGSLEWETSVHKKVVLDLAPEAAENLMEFACGALTDKVRGSVLVPLKDDKMETTSVQKYTETKGKQKPEAYEASGGGKVRDILESDPGGAEYEQTGLSLTDTQTNEEALEVNTYATPKPPRWWVAGALLVGSEPIAEETNMTVPFKLEFALEGGKGPKFTIECTKEKVKNGYVEGPATRAEEAEIYEGCIVVGKTAECTVNSTLAPVGTIRSAALKAVLEGTAGAAKLKFVPESGTRIASYEIGGGSCAQKGFYEADGAMICDYSGVQIEGAEHPLEFTKTSGTTLTVGGNEAHLTVTDNVHLASGKLWSAF